MNDLISRKAAIDEVKQLYEWHDTVTEDRLIDHLKRLPSAQPDLDEWCTDCKEYDQKQHCCHRWTKVIRNTVEEIKVYQQWIPVSKRLPDKEDVYLITSNKGNVYLWSYKPDMSKIWVRFVTAWSYLPEPYKE